MKILNLTDFLKLKKCRKIGRHSFVSFRTSTFTRRF
jgi:hypothetical protein